MKLTSLILFLVTFQSVADEQKMSNLELVDNLQNVVWIDQRASTKKLRFRLAFENKQTEDWEDPPNPMAIEVLDKASGQRVQLIRGFESSLPFKSDQSDLITVHDANFDGHPDISMLAFGGGAGPNYTRNFFLFNPKTAQFEFNEELSNLSQVGIDKKNKTVTSAQRISCCQHVSETYRYVNGKLVTVAYWDQHMTEDGKSIEETCRLVRGKFHCKTRIMPPETSQ